MKPSRSSFPKGFDFGSDDVLCPYNDYDPSLNHHQTYPSPPPPPPPPSLKAEVRECASRRSSSGNTGYEEGYNSEVQRSVQIMRDKQELAETQKELSKLQLVQREYPDTKHTDSKTEAAISTTEVTKAENLPNPHNPALQTQSVMGYSMLPNQSATLVPLPSSAADQNIPYKQEPFQSSTLPPVKSAVEFQKQASTSQQAYHYNQMKSNIPYHAHHSYQTKHEPDPCRIQNPQTTQPYQNESSSFPPPYHPQQQPWVSPSPQPHFSPPQEQTEIRTEMTPAPSVPFYSYHVPTSQRTMVVSSQQMFPNQLVPQSSGVPQPSLGSRSEERSGHGGNYGGYRYPNASASSYQQQQQMQPPPFRQANPNEISRAPHHLSSTYSHDVPKVVYDADLGRHPYSHYYQQQNRQQ
ncbi:hypothetical protein EJ110_NYTH06901 [Nymphaea thermarum]|nr:hypothetical protein EJ110_NYTH06901 [Nymphaea thermarum]